MLTKTNIRRKHAQTLHMYCRTFVLFSTPVRGHLVTPLWGWCTNGDGSTLSNDFLGLKSHPAQSGRVDKTGRRYPCGRHSGMITAPPALMSSASTTSSCAWRTPSHCPTPTTISCCSSAALTAKPNKPETAVKNRTANPILDSIDR